MALPAPKRRETYQKYVARAFRYAKRNKGAVRGAYTGKGKKQVFHAQPVMKAVGVRWRQHKKTLTKRNK